MARKFVTLLVASVFITALILAAAPLFARNPLSEQIWRPNNGRGPPPPGGKEPPPHDWNPEHSDEKKRPAKNAVSYQHSALPVGVFPEPEVRHRYEGAEVWRGQNEVMPVDKYMVPQRGPRERPVAKPMEKFKHKAEWMEQQIVADYPDHPLVEDTFVMIKTGSQTQWKRMPWHMYTTIPKVKHFGLYSDHQGSIAGYEIVDILRDLPEDVMKKDEFKRYKLAQQMSEEHWSWEGAELNVKGGWELDKYKNMPILYHAYKTNPDAKWYFMIDDDTFVFWDNLYQLLDKYNSTEPYYLGSPSYLGASYPFAHGGSGYAISHGAMTKLFDHSEQQNKVHLDEWARKAGTECCGDFVNAIALDSVGVHLDKLGYDGYKMYGAPFHGGNIWGYVFIPGMFKTQPITLHHIDGHQAEVLYEYEKLRGGAKGLTNAELYRDFVLPHITHVRRNWRMPRRDKTYKRRQPKPDENQDPEHEGYAPLKDDGKPLFPYLTPDTCKRTCELNDECVQWCHAPGLCELATIGVTLGRGSNKHQYGSENDEAEKWHTGWMIDRIRHKRNLDETDPLEYNGETKTWNDDDKTSEGWYVRQLIAEQYHPYDKDVATF